MSENDRNDSDFYLTDVSPKDKPWDVHRSEAQQLEELYRQTALFDKYADQIHQCSRVLGFKSEVADTGELKIKLGFARYCRIRHCPVCQWRKVKVWYARFLKALPAIMADHPKGRWVFLTLTVRNCEVSDLKSTITQMNKAWQRLSQRKEFCALGWVKSLEVTRAWDCYEGATELGEKYLGRHGLTWVQQWERNYKRKIRLVATDEVHPHFHVMMLVPSSYFTHKYVKHARWIELWRDALRIDYLPWVHMRRVDWNPKQLEVSKDFDEPPKPYVDSGIVDVSGLEEPQKFIIYAVLEVLKYQIKPSDLLLDLNPEWLEALTLQLRGTRAVALGGVIKKYLKEEEPSDDEMTHLNDESEDTEEEDIKFWFGWRDQIRRYQKKA